MTSRVLLLGMLLSLVGPVGIAAAGGTDGCREKKFPANARVRSAELDDLFGKAAPAARPLRFAYAAGTGDAEENRILAGVEAEAKRFGIALETAPPEGDPFAGTPPDALLVAAENGVAAKRLLEAAASRGVPAIAVGGRLGGARVSVAAEDARFGAMAAEYLHELFPAGAALADVSGPAATPEAAARTAGFAEEMRYYPNLALAGSFSTDGTKGGARAVVAAAMAAHPEIKGIFAGSDAMALGALEALKSLKLFEVAVVASGGTLEGRDALAKRTIKGTVARFPEKEGGLAVQAGLRLLACHEIPPWIVPPQVMLTPKNLEDFAPASQ